MHTYANIAGVPDYTSPSDYEDAPNSISINTTADDEDVYIDPGHNEELMCTHFREKSRCVINKSDIRFGLM